ncbi:phosphogluconate dehydrogenase (NADP(+)-dependent, decarboxylating) [Rubricoccus marinus]|uniref:6-phosphogluconate dehydrogenase, decarboxylating n=2 Tax=Rubricoccus marinus TaxID=716817 RepID=A0A259U4E3_9BACT|nr:phosphogluconate dehydrogenase (NADP(+)-dependent, decarboxylating) [Rubricoccus marinus]
MGRNLALNAADEGIAVAGYDLGQPAVDAILAEASGEQRVFATTSLDDFLTALPTPRAILVMVPSGPAVDAVITSLKPHLTGGDLLIDGGNSHYTDTARRQAELEAEGLHFMGMGVSGGEEGARHGPSLMPGGPKDAYERVRPTLEAIAAKVDGDPCVTHLGPGGSGHYVKMVHNGIEYGLMQLLAEAYDVLHRGVGLDDDALAARFSTWNDGPLQSFLVEISAAILRQKDDLPAPEAPENAAPAEGRLIDRILDKAKQKGTGKWTSQDALDLGVPIPTIDAAVAARYVSAQKATRERIADTLADPDLALDPGLEDRLEDALLAAFLVTYAQGFSMLAEASREYEWDLVPNDVARIWRGGCIIRAAMLEPFRSAFEADPDLPTLLLAPEVSDQLSATREALGEVVAAAARAGIPVPALSASLAYLDSMRSARVSANMIQAQRDFFGAHTYERTDREGTFHTEWDETVR